MKQYKVAIRILVDRPNLPYCIKNKDLIKPTHTMGATINNESTTDAALERTAAEATWGWHKFADQFFALEYAVIKPYNGLARVEAS